MTPAARAATAIELLDAILAGAPAERELTRWSRASRFAGSRDRAAVRDLVYDCLRCRRSFAWLGASESGRGLVLGWAVQAGIDPGEIFSGERFAPEPLTAGELSASGRPLSGAPRAVRLDYPDFLEAELKRGLGRRFEPVLAAMRERAPIDLRVNRMKADVATAIAALAEGGITACPHVAHEGALRVEGDGRTLRATGAFNDGLVELQDLSSQMVAAAAGARPGMVVLDYCAGGGGKALALAADMGGEGRLFAYDINPARMNDIPDRAARAGVRITVMDGRDMGRLTGACDLVLVDAPCSGTGAWRRNPDHKWKFRPADLDVLLRSQRAILQRARQFVRPGGRLVYATCSLLHAENEAQASDFSKAEAANCTRSFRLLPPEQGDGFYFSEFSLD